MRVMSVAVLVALSAACGGSESTPAAPTPGTPGALTVTISAAGTNPSTLTLTPGTRVLFVNNDTRPHNMTSDPHPEHDICPEINQVGLLQPGQSRETGNMNIVRTCGFHDHDNPPPSGSRWTGSLTTR